MNDILGAALKDYQQGHRNHKLWIHNKYGNSEAMPVSTYFRGIEDMPPLELLALEGCYGDVLDVGAGAGSHALVLQQRKINVTAIDISGSAAEVMQQRGIKKVVTGNIFTYSQKKFNTILLLMNGIGLAGLKQLLFALKNILKPGGHILCDSSDVT